MSAHCPTFEGYGKVAWRTNHCHFSLEPWMSDKNHSTELQAQLQIESDKRGKLSIRGWKEAHWRRYENIQHFVWARFPSSPDMRLVVYDPFTGWMMLKLWQIWVPRSCCKMLNGCTGSSSTFCISGCHTAADLQGWPWLRYCQNPWDEARDWHCTEGSGVQLDLWHWSGGLAMKNHQFL